MRSGRRELGLACLLTLVGALCVLLATGRRWLPEHAAVLPDQATGGRLVPLAPPVGLVALAGVVALLAARRWGRPAVGSALAAGGLAVIASTVPRVGGAVLLWPVLTVLGGALLTIAGALAVVRGRSWPALGARYESPAARPRDPELDAWAALDRGEDPTRRPPADPRADPRADPAQPG